MAMSAENEHPVKALGWAARDSSGLLSSFKFSRRHDIVGVVTEVGTKVTKFKVGDRVGVGCVIGSCHNCVSCGDDLENYCPEMVPVYGSKFSHDSDGTINYGGFSDIMVSVEHFVLKFPNNMPLNGGAPLLCAGITVYSPLRYYGLDKPRMHLGVVGLGGPGHMAVKFAKAMGLKVTVISISPSKREICQGNGPNFLLEPRSLL